MHAFFQSANRATLTTLGCAVASALALAACSTDDVRPDVTLVSDPSFDSRISLYVTRDDAYDADLTANNLSPYRVQVDGRYVAYDESQYILAGSNGSVSFALPAGEHVVALVDDQGRTAVTSPTVETKPGGDPAQPFSSPAIVFFGGPTTMRARVIVDDPAAVPAGSIHVRVMNAFVDHQPVQVVQCPTALDGSRLYTAANARRSVIRSRTAISTRPTRPRTSSRSSDSTGRRRARWIPSSPQ